MRRFEEDNQASNAQDSATEVQCSPFSKSRRRSWLTAVAVHAATLVLAANDASGGSEDSGFPARLSAGG
jgi:hypothetical protein